MGMENKKIVAPAGVDVKSFMGSGLRIPEGYKGVIEDGVFRLVKQESEDERTRKHIIEILERLAPCHWDGNEKSECIAYLEKQRPNIELIQRSWYMEGYHDREFGQEPKWVIKTGEGGPKYEKNEKYGQPLEQKPVKVYDNMDDLIADAMIKEISESDMLDSAKHNRIYWIKKHRQKPADMMFTFDDVLALGSAMDLARGDKKLYGTLKSILGRVYDAYRGEQQPAESDSIKGGVFISDGKRVFLVLANVEERNFGEIGSSYCEGLILGIDGVVYCDGGDFKKYKRATSDERAKFIHDLNVGVKLKEQPAEWSEEDEKMMNSIIDVLEGESARCVSEDGSVVYENDYYKEVDWLKSLRPQPKPEWSEEDETMWSNLIGYLEGKVGILPSGKERNIKWLKERFVKLVYPKPSWKPSEEQMRCLEFAIKQLERNYLIGPGRAEDKGLYQLVNDLKKL